MRTANRCLGLSLVELLVAVAISLVVVLAAAYLYLAGRETQRVTERNSSSLETGSFVMQLLGREIMLAGYYPATVDASATGMYDSYPPLSDNPPKDTDWIPSAPAFKAGIFGCDGKQFGVPSNDCVDHENTGNTRNTADTLVINHFTNDSGAVDCPGSLIRLDPSNAQRILNSHRNTPTSPHRHFDPEKPLQFPLFASSRFTLKSTTISQNGQDINTKSLVCTGNGRIVEYSTYAWHPIISGIEDLQFKYGVYGAGSEANAAHFLSASMIIPSGYSWEDVIAVEVCLLTHTVGRAGDTKQRKYLNCDHQKKDQPAAYTITRHIAVFGLRNNLRQHY